MKTIHKKTIIAFNSLNIILSKNLLQIIGQFYFMVRKKKMQIKLYIQNFLKKMDIL